MYMYIYVQITVCPQEPCAGCAAQEDDSLLFVHEEDYNLQDNVKLLFSEPMDWSDEETRL